MIKTSLSIVIPVYNEEFCLNRTLLEVYEVAKGNFIDFEIIFINDGSVDNSESILISFARNFPCVRILQNDNNQGIGSALRKGFSAASKDIIFYIDCDLPTDTVFILQAVNFLKEYNIIIGKRNNRENLLRSILSFSYDCIIRILFNLDLNNINSGIKVFKRDVLKDLQLVSTSSFLNAEILIKAKRRGFRIKEVPCIFYSRTYGKSKLCTLKSIISISWEIFMFIFRK